MPPPATGKKRSRKAVVIAVIAGIVGLLIVAGAVVAVIFLVFTASGPTATLNEFFAAAEKKDIDATMKLVDTSYFAGNSDLEQVLKDQVFADIPDGMKFTGIGYKTNITGDKATVQVIKGTATYDQDGKKKTLDLSKSAGDTTFDLVKKDGTWYISPSSFGSTFAASFKQAAEDIFNNEINPKVTELGKVFEDVNSFITSQPIPSGAAIQSKVNAIQPTLDAYKAEAKKARQQYQKIIDLKGRGLEDYQEYAKAGAGFVGTSIELFDEAMALERYVADTKLKLDAGQTVDPNAYSQHVDEVSKKLDELKTREDGYQKDMEEADSKIQ